MTAGVAAVVLAAGGSARLGGDLAKPLVPLAGRPLVAYALDAAVGSGLAPVLLVVGRDAGRVAALAHPPVEVVRHDGWADGLASSVGAALRALEPRVDVEAAVVGLADQPLVGADAYRRLAAAHAAGATLAAATYGGARRNPVLLGRAHWEEARALTGDQGARVLLDRHADAVVAVPCDGTGAPDDVDTPDDLAAMEARCRSSTGSA